MDKFPLNRIVPKFFTTFIQCHESQVLFGLDVLMKWYNFRQLPARSCKNSVEAIPPFPSDQRKASMMAVITDLRFTRRQTAPIRAS